jgi:hypothetical protein
MAALIPKNGHVGGVFISLAIPPTDSLVRKIAHGGAAGAAKCDSQIEHHNFWSLAVQGWFWCLPGPANWLDNKMASSKYAVVCCCINGQWSLTVLPPLNCGTMTGALGTCLFCVLCHPP